MRRAIGAHETCAIERENHRQVLDRDVVNQLVVRALKEGRIDRHHRLEPFACEAGREGHGVLLGDAHVVVATGKALFELDEARAFAHGGRDADQSAVLRGHVAQPCAEHLREGLLGRGRGLDEADGRIELGGPVIGHRVGLGQLVALALLGDHVQELRTVAGA